MDSARERAAGFLKKNSGTILAIGVALLTALVLLTGAVGVNLGEDELTVGATFAGRTSVRYDDILSAHLIDEMDYGSRLSGVSTVKLKAGRYLNDQYGGYTLYAYTAVKSCIVMRTQEGYVVFNGPGVDETNDIYQELVARLPDVP